MKFKPIWIPIAISLLMMGGFIGAAVFGTKDNDAQADAPPAWWKDRPRPTPTIRPTNEIVWKFDAKDFDRT